MDTFVIVKIDQAGAVEEMLLFMYVTIYYVTD